MKTKTMFLGKLHSPLGTRGNRYAQAEVLNNMNGWVLAGHGEESNELCGEFKGLSKLQGEEKYITHFMNCKKLGCPICMPGAAAKKAHKMSLILLARAKFHSNRVKHFSFNFTLKLFEFLNIHDKKFTYATFKKLRLRFSYFLRSIGIQFGYLFFHSHRFAGDDQEKVKVSPHFHVIGVGRVPKADQFYKMFGWTYRNHGERKWGYNIKSTIAYLLSHVGLYPNKPSYYWFQTDKERSYYTKYHRVKTDGAGKAYYSVDPKIYMIYPDENLNAMVSFTVPDPDKYLEDPLILEYWEIAYKSIRIKSEVFEVPETIMEYKMANQHKHFDKLMQVWESRFIRYIP